MAIFQKQNERPREGFSPKPLGRWRVLQRGVLCPEPGPEALVLQSRMFSRLWQYSLTVRPHAPSDQDSTVLKFYSRDDFILRSSRDCQINGRALESGVAEGGEDQALPALSKADGGKWGEDGAPKSGKGISLMLWSYRKLNLLEPHLPFCGITKMVLIIEWWADWIFNDLTTGSAPATANIGIWSAEASFV